MDKNIKLFLRCQDCDTKCPFCNSVGFVQQDEEPLLAGHDLYRRVVCSNCSAPYTEIIDLRKYLPEETGNNGK